MFPRGLLQQYSSPVSLIARILDVFCVTGAAFAAHYWRFGDVNLNSSYQIAVLLAVLLSLILFSAANIYTSWRGQTWFHHARLVVAVWLSVVVLLILIGFLTKTSTIFSRQWLGMWTIMGTVALLCLRYLIYRILIFARIRGWNHKRIVIVGTGELARGVAGRIRESDWIGLDIVNFIGNKADEDESLRTIDGIEVKYGLNQLDGIVSRRQVDEVWLALPLQEERQIKGVLHQLRHSTITIRFVPGIFEYRLLNHAVNEIAGLPVIDLNATPMVGINRVMKALEDRVFGFIILLLVSPLILAIAIAIKLTSQGPVFFKQMRHGWDGKPIKIYKFRTMVEHQAGDIVQASRKDVRVTKIGAFLRRTSLDELPQFWNVMQGRMSIVGPRPHALQHNEHYKDQIDLYMLRHKVKPGITGWAQINGWRGETDTLDKMKKRVEYDLYYIENWSLWLDLKIMFLTLFNGFIHKNAY